MKVFADAFFYVALLNRHDEYHVRVMDWARGFGGEIITTQWVLTEVADAFAGSRIRRDLLHTFADPAADVNTDLIGVSPAHFQRGMDLYHARPDKEWSLTDCISFVVMADEGLTEALTGDRHFEQAGFKALLA